MGEKKGIAKILIGVAKTAQVIKETKKAQSEALSKGQTVMEVFKKLIPIILAVVAAIISIKYGIQLA